MSKKIVLTKTRQQITNLDSSPIYDRSLINYKKYNNRIGHAGVKYSMAVQATLADIVSRLINKEKKLLEHDELINLPGIAFNKSRFLQNINSLNAANF